MILLHVSFMSWHRQLIGALSYVLEALSLAQFSIRSSSATWLVPRSVPLWSSLPDLPTRSVILHGFLGAAVLRPIGFAENLAIIIATAHAYV
ncbi:hypothetical protein SODALDRAFT_54839 [Sodiomyces alkalinus F11]|uniref:Uncharacterized protein n=1 Tax=Sodiomyces alkalinus (strain CBS 110278 / VKM F-3762 / F11) TaxID=1314773 RepID=A0A3N2PN44_SODAK|nr:hypothetical protein SODALDRAFT_54839 [Sodiomyces alkalinus F11]ROT35945.1 hypothetical protein SODALDRAFT_54839 [Sodiomyces alkalinus F11]